MTQLALQLAKELNAQVSQVNAAIGLLDEGATVPFIARYRKEATGGLDDTQLRLLEQRLGYLREMDERRQVILKTIADQGQLTDALAGKIANATSKTELEELYLPYKPKRRTKGEIAKEAGLLPLADALLQDPNLDPESEAAKYHNSEHAINDNKAALDGARYILIERFAEDADLLAKLRKVLLARGHLQAQVIEGKQQEGAKFSDYFNHSEALRSVPSHRALAMFRARNEGIVTLTINPDPASETPQQECEAIIAEHVGIQSRRRAADAWLQTVVTWTWKLKLALYLENELLTALREQAELDAIGVFAKNLKDLLLAAPAGSRRTMGLDPGLRTGVKVAVVDETGKLLVTNTIYPHAPQNQWDKSVQVLGQICQTLKVDLIAIGNGTASRETDKLAAEVIKAYPQLKLTKVMVSEAGASVYSASELAALEFPELDVSLRGAVSIARRLQDPLAELVKIEPKAIGVGQYQHDVSQSQLAKSLDAVVEDCVNSVGVDINSASAPLLARVSGLNKTLAQNVVSYRDSNGRFDNRKALLKVPRLGPKAYEQCAGFLRIQDGDNPLDASCVHPESYPVVEKMLGQLAKPLTEVMGNKAVLNSIKPSEFVDQQFGLPTITDILNELEKPGRDPRPEFKTAEFKEGVETLKDLSLGMILEGVVTNVTNFGAFVDIGVHQDGLVHISSLTDKFVSDPREVVKAGDIVKVKVLEVDIARKRIGLTMRMDEQPNKAAAGKPAGKDNFANKPQFNERREHKPREQKPSAPMNSAFADAFAAAKRK